MAFSVLVIQVEYLPLAGGPCAYGALASLVLPYAFPLFERDAIGFGDPLGSSLPFPAVVATVFTLAAG